MKEMTIVTTGRFQASRKDSGETGLIGLSAQGQKKWATLEWVLHLRTGAFERRVCKALSYPSHTRVLVNVGGHISTLISIQ